MTSFVIGVGVDAPAVTATVLTSFSHSSLTIVVGDPKSNNSNRLAQVSEEIAGTKAYRIGESIHRCGQTALKSG
jgi:4-hydroxy-3-methylbut-2-enyl diphosphate reductase IspH